MYNNLHFRKSACLSLEFDHYKLCPYVKWSVTSEGCRTDKVNVFYQLFKKRDVASSPYKPKCMLRMLM